MYTEKEMMDKIMDTAEKDERVRAVYMQGSRINPAVPVDIYRDFDIVFAVCDVRPFLLPGEDCSAIFGPALIVQEPNKLDALCGKMVDFSKHYCIMMLLENGSRVDLQLVSLSEVHEHFVAEPAVKLLDKDGVLNGLESPDYSIYSVGLPEEGAYIAVCNDFWWCLQNVVKGLCRDELPYAMGMYNEVVRVKLDKMVTWYIAAERGTPVYVGKMNKYLKRLLNPALWAQYCKTYPSPEKELFWRAIDEACDLMHKMAAAVAEKCGYIYAQADEDGMHCYLSALRKLGPDAGEINVL